MSRPARRARPAPPLGQHFLHDRRIVARIAGACGVGVGDVVLEIGAGQGVLTRALAAAGARVVAVEIDARLALPLRASAPPGVEVVLADVLALDLAELARREGRPLVVAGNLPYRISSPVLFRLLDARGAWSCAVLMLQREVAARLGASPGGRDYGVLAARLGAEIDVAPLFDVAPGAFRPPPRVHSRVVRLVPLSSPRASAPRAAYAAVVRAAFAQRRKTLGNALRALVAPEALAGLGIDPRRRGETLSVEEFDRIALAVDRARAS